MFTRATTMKYSTIFFRVGFAILALIYLAVMFEFFAPQQLNLSFEMRLDVILLTIGVVGYLYFFLRRKKLS